MVTNKLEIIFNFIFGKKIFYSLFFIFFILFIISLWNRYIQIDENFFGEQAYWLIHEGIVKIKSMPGILNFDKEMLLYHKLFVWIAALIILIFDWSVYPLKIFILIMFILFFYVYYQYYKSNKNKISYEQIVISSVIIILTPAVIMQAFIFRPEIFVMTIGFCSYFFLDKYLRNNKIKDILLGSIFAGIAFLITPNGLLFSVAGGILLLFNKKFKIIPLYGIIIFSISIIFFIDVFPDKLDILIYQFKNYPTHNFDDNYMSNSILNAVVLKILNLLNEHKRFFWSERVAITSFMFLFSLILFFKKLYKNHKSLIIYTISLIIALNVFGSHIAERYLIHYIPFMALIIAYGIVELKNRLKYHFVKIIFIISLFAAVYVTVLRYSIIYSWNKNYTEIHHKILNKIDDKNANILVPWQFIYNEIDAYNLISYKAFEYREDKLENKWTQEEFLQIAAKELNIEYIVTDAVVRRKSNVNWFKNKTIGDNPYFVEFFTYDEYIIFKKIK